MCPKEYRDPFHAPATPTVSVTGAALYQVRVSSVNSAGAESLASAVLSGSTVTVTPVRDVELYYVYTRESDEDAWKYRILTASVATPTIDVNNGSGSTVVAAYEKTGKTALIDNQMVYEWKRVRSYSGSHSDRLYTYTETPDTSTDLWWVRWKSENRVDKTKLMTERVVAFHNPSSLTLVILGSTIPAQPGAPLDKPDSYPGAVGIFQQHRMVAGFHCIAQSIQCGGSIILLNFDPSVNRSKESSVFAFESPTLLLVELIQHRIIVFVHPRQFDCDTLGIEKQRFGQQFIHFGIFPHLIVKLNFHSIDLLGKHHVPDIELFESIKFRQRFADRFKLDLFQNLPGSIHA